MTSCYPATFENGTDTRVYVDSNDMTAIEQAKVATWVKIGGETSCKISIKPKTADTSNKDATGAMSAPTGYEWSISVEAIWDLDNAGQMKLRAMPLALEIRRIAWRPSTATVGYYGYASGGWDGDAGDKAVTKFSASLDGCGDITYGG